MNFTSQMRINPETGEYEKYYRLKESYRNAEAFRTWLMSRATGDRPITKSAKPPFVSVTVFNG
jgi:hypothetical protein